MDDINQQLKQIKAAWDTITTVPDDLTSWGFPGLTKQSIADAIGGMAELSAQIDKKDYVPLATSKAFLIQTLTNLKTHVTTHLPSNPQPHIPGFLSLIEQARTLIRHMHEEADGQTRRVYGSAAEKLAIALSRVSDATKIYDVVINTRDAALTATTEANNAAANAEEAASKITELQNNATNKVESIDVYIEELKSDKELVNGYANQIHEMVSSFSDLKSELENGKTTQNELFSEFEKYRKQAEAILERTNQASLAGSFISRKNQLRWSQVFWGGIFMSSIGLLSCIGFILIFPNFPFEALINPSPNMSPDIWKAMLQHLPLTAPLIWLGWFAARQYGFSSRLGEDYAFKVATAMAFEGYKREANEAGGKIYEKLLETAIDNFGDNPLRIFNDHANHASPTHELLEKVMKDSNLKERIFELFKKADGA